MNPVFCPRFFDDHLQCFFLFWKRDRDRRVQKRPHKNNLQCDSLSLRPSLSIFVRTILDATVTVTLQNQKETLYLIQIIDNNFIWLL
jgi:hypothetical protein